LPVGDARQSAGWLLPILCTADVFAVYYWRKHAAASRLFSLTPWSWWGVALGAVASHCLNETLRPVVGIIIFVMLAAYLWRRYRPESVEAVTHPAPYGVSAGFATTVANAAGPVMNLYLLSNASPRKNCSHRRMVLLPHQPHQNSDLLWHGLITVRSLAFAVAMIPAVFIEPSPALDGPPYLAPSYLRPS